MSASQRKIIERLAEIVQPPPPRAPVASPITVHAAISRFSVFYEKVRNAVDYRDDHLLRKAAIARILKRQLALEGDASAAATQLVRELIAARYLPNGVLPEDLYAQVSLVIEKYLQLHRIKAGDERHDEWLMGIVAAEIEEVVDDHTQVKGFINFLFERLAGKITVDEKDMSDTERRLQVYIACYRSLVKADDEMIGFKLSRAYQPKWMEPETWIDNPRAMAEEMLNVERSVRHALVHPLNAKFQSLVKPWAISLGILQAALNENPSGAAELMEDEEALFLAVQRIADRRMRESKGKVRRVTVRAMIYLFITKIVFALALEIPFELVLYKHVDRFALATNILFPPVLMFAVGSMIRMPGKENVKRIKQCVKELLSQDGPLEKRIKVPKERGSFGRVVFGLGYALAFLLTFGAIFSILGVFNFTWVSSLIFMFFLCIVSFFAFRLRISAQEFIAVERPDRLTNLVVDFFSIPILRAGRWLSQTISRLNIFIFFFDFIVEAPFKIFLNVLEEWSAFMKEKKDQIQ